MFNVWIIGRQSSNLMFPIQYMYRRRSCFDQMFNIHSAAGPSGFLNISKFKELLTQQNQNFSTAFVVIFFHFSVFRYFLDFNIVLNGGGGVLLTFCFEFNLVHLYLLCGFHTRARSVTIATIDKSQLIGTFCQNLTF